MGLALADPHSTQLTGLGAGFTIAARGSVAYLVKCEDVSTQVTLRQTENCFEVSSHFRHLGVVHKSESIQDWIQL